MASCFFLDDLQDSTRFLKTANYVLLLYHICYLQAQSYEVVVLRQGGFGEKAVELAKDLLASVLRYVSFSNLRYGENDISPDKNIKNNCLITNG